MGLDNTATTFTGGIIGTGGLTKVGSGVLNLNNSNFTNSWNGPTTINGGLLIVGSAQAMSRNSAVTVNNGGTLVLAGVAADAASRCNSIPAAPSTARPGR